MTTTASTTIERNTFGSSLVHMLEKTVREAFKDGRTSISVDSITYQPPLNVDEAANLTIKLTVDRYPPKTCEEKDIPKGLELMEWQVGKSPGWTQVEMEMNQFLSALSASRQVFSMERARADFSRHLDEAVKHCDKRVWKDEWKECDSKLSTEDNADITITSYPDPITNHESGYQVEFELALRGVSQGPPAQSIGLADQTWD